MLRSSIAGGAFAAAFALAVPSAMAADMPAPDYSAPPPVTEAAPLGYDWSGFYAGVHAGYGWADFDAGGLGIDGDGFHGGGQIGANWQFNNFVLGVEGDLSWADFDGSEEVIPGITANAEADWLGTIRARAGVAFDRVLVYGTGGVAFTGAEVSVPVLGLSDDATHIGWALGGGVEVGMTENVSLKAEYLYTDFGSEDYNIGGTPVSVDYDAHLLRAGLNFRFGGGMGY